MMNLLLVLDHPYTLDSAANVPHRRSFSAALAASAIRGAEAAGHHVDVIDLAADGFRPAMSREDLTAWRQGLVVDPLVVDYQERLFTADRLTFVFPVWWEAMPAATKGFLDRVLVKGVAYDERPFARGNPFRNRLTNLDGVDVLSVMTTPHAAYRWWFGSPLVKILFKGTFGKIGVRNLTWTNYPAITATSPERRQELLDRTERHYAHLGTDVRKPAVHRGPGRWTLRRVSARRR